MGRNRIYGKKGIEASWNFIILWVVLPAIAGLFIWIIYSSVASASVEKGFKDDLCRMNNAFIGAMPTGAKAVMPWITCNERTVKVDANNFDKCPEEKEKGTEDITACTHEQLYSLALRCWDMFGRNDIDYGRIKEVGEQDRCFRFTVRDLGTEAIDEDTFTNWMMKNEKCKRLANDKVLSVMHNRNCGNYDAVDWKPSGFGLEEMNSGECWRIAFNPDSFLGVRHNWIKFKPC